MKRGGRKRWNFAEADDISGCTGFLIKFENMW